MAELKDLTIKLRNERRTAPLRIVSDGTAMGTTLYCGDTIVDNVGHAEWEVNAGDGLARAMLYVYPMPADVTGNGSIEEYTRAQVRVPKPPLRRRLPMALRFVLGR